MKQLTINVTDSKYSFFVELIGNMDFLQILDDKEIPQEHKDIIDERLEKIKENPDRLLNWNKVKHQIKF